MKYMVEFVNKLRADGSQKSKKEIESEVKILLNTYRRQNAYLNDRLFDLQNNVLPGKDKTIVNLKNQIVKLDEQLKTSKISWFG